MNPGEKNISEELAKIYGDVSEWLKFAETKHAAVFAAWIAILIAALSIDKFYALSIFWNVVIIIPILVGMAINLMAFMPFTNRSKMLRNRCKTVYGHIEENCVFYQSIFVHTYNENWKLKEQMEKYKTMLESSFEHPAYTKLDDDYVTQIIEVSTVATIKIYLFSLSVKYIVCLLCLIFVSLIIA